MEIHEFWQFLAAFVFYAFTLYTTFDWLLRKRPQDEQLSSASTDWPSVKVEGCTCDVCKAIPLRVKRGKESDFERIDRDVYGDFDISQPPTLNTR